MHQIRPSIRIHTQLVPARELPVVEMMLERSSTQIVISLECQCRNAGQQHLDLDSSKSRANRRAVFSLYVEDASNDF